MTGAIIAGGASSRFGGEPKGLLEVGGSRIIDRVAGALRAVASDIVLVANAVEAHTWLPEARAISDIRSERGSLVGIHTALSYARDSVMVVAWDMPFVTPALLRLVAARGGAEQFAAIPESAHGLEPFCAMYTESCLPILEGALDAGEFRMSNVLARFPSLTRITPGEIATVGDPARLFFNVNDAGDLAIAERMAAGS